MDHIKSVKSLLDAGADVNMANSDNYTALFLTPHDNYPRHYMRCVKALLQADVPINKVNHLDRNALAEVLQYNDVEISKLLFAAGETLENADDREIPDCLRFDDLQLQLKHICREAIRKHLLKLDPHQHLFSMIPKLGLLSALMNYLLYGESLDKNDADDSDDNDDDDDDDDESESGIDDFGKNDDDEESCNSEADGTGP